MNGTENKDRTEQEELEFYKSCIKKFVNVDFILIDNFGNHLNKTAKGILQSVSDDGMLFIKGDYKEWVVKIEHITNFSAVENRGVKE